MEHWWVNHKQTFTLEVSGGYLWSPKRNKNGAKSHFYDNMAKVRPGDLIFSYAGAEIRAIGVATDKASSAKKPSEFGTAGANWDNDGWYVPVEFKLLDNPLRPKSYMHVIGPLLAEKYAPLNSEGNGNQGAYLSHISEELAQILFDLIKAPQTVQQLVGIGVGSEMEESDDQAETQLKQRTDISDTEKEQLVKARRGQGIFRSNVEAIEPDCRITGLKLKEHLRASHIKPWRVCDNGERLDGNNGLLLAPHVDHLFDKGFISFSDQGQMIISTRLDQSVLDAWNIDKNTNVGAFSAKQAVYLAFHRTHVFQAG